jgi:superfamily II DNA or RNA helicase
MCCYDEPVHRDFLLVATPGSGKTAVALTIAYRMLRDEDVERVVIVCPTDHLRRQWAAAAARLGIDVDPLWSNADGIEAPDYFGVVVTYQQVSYAPDLYRMNCKRRTLVIFDEIHHGASCVRVRRILMSLLINGPRVFNRGYKFSI